jgi:hypothetical protein
LKENQHDATACRPQKLDLLPEVARVSMAAKFGATFAAKRKPQLKGRVPEEEREYTGRTKVPSVGSPEGRTCQSGPAFKCYRYPREIAEKIGAGKSTVNKWLRQMQGKRAKKSLDQAEVIRGKIAHYTQLSHG